METWSIYRTCNSLVNLPKARYKGESGLLRKVSRRAQAEKEVHFLIANVVAF